MKRPNITPGPWEAQGYLNDVVALPLKKMVSAMNRGDPEMDSMANARAIAALPDLLAALEDCYKSLSILPDVDGAYRLTCMEQARNALIKAGYTFNE